jgi:mono/diheme cytochrome c family protein
MMARWLIRILSAAVFAAMLLCSPASAPVTAAPAGAVPADDKELAAKGKALYGKYKCYDCHGMNGEGTADAPDLIGTRLDADGISAFLQNPSADATNKGMPSFAKDSPDIAPLVAFVLSIKQSK